MTQSKVITVTLNPSLDRTITAHYLAQGYHNRVGGSTRLDPAGEGVSISRALHQLNCLTHAVILVGNDPVGKAYEALIREEAFAATLLKAAGQTRSDTIILDTGNENETHLVEDCSPLTQEALQRVQSALQHLTHAGDIVVLAGTLPPQSPVNAYADLIKTAHLAGAETIVTVGVPELDEVLKAKPRLVALTQLQAEVFFNFPVRHLEDVAYCARQLRDQGVNKVLVGMQETATAFLASAEGEWMITLPEFESGTSSGVWPALLAGFLAGRVQQRPLPQSLELGAATAAYAASQVGNEFGSLTDVKEHLRDVDANPIDPDKNKPDLTTSITASQ